MGVLGANPQIPKSTQTGISGGQNFTPQSGNAPKVSDADLVTEEPSGSTTAPTKESPAAPHQETMADKRKDEVLKRKKSHILHRVRSTISYERDSNSYGGVD